MSVSPARKAVRQTPIAPIEGNLALVAAMRRAVPFAARHRGPLAAFALLSVLVGCQLAPFTGRRQFVAVPEQQEIELGRSAWEETLAQNTLSSAANAELVEQVGRRLAAVADRPAYQWEFKLIASEQQNAFALPGGKVALYEGILPICRNEAGLAVVMSHEIAHVLARHGNERMSQQGAVKIAGGVLDGMTADDAEKQERWRNAFGVASQYGLLLPYSRTHESEADSIGLMLMAKAGYDPEEAPRFWQRFASAGGKKPIEFFSTHPSDEHRAGQLNMLLPQALAVYQKAPEKYGAGLALSLPPRSTGSAASSQIAAAAAPRKTAGGNILPAAFSEEFVPPIARQRTDDAAPAVDSAPPVASTHETPAPFPGASAAAPPADSTGTWKPSSHRGPQ